MSQEHAIKLVALVLIPSIMAMANIHNELVHLIFSLIKGKITNSVITCNIVQSTFPPNFQFFLNLNLNASHSAYFSTM